MKTRRHFLVLPVLLVFTAAMAQQLPPYHLQLATVEMGKLPPRTEFIATEDNPYYTSLNGTWDFCFDGAWHKIQVPGNWEVQGFGTPIYVNARYEFMPSDPKPPTLPKDIPMGIYKRTFTLTKDWTLRDTYLSIGGAKSGCYVVVNGQLVGYNEDSKNTAEYLLTPYVHEGENTLELHIYRWSTGSYLECQDFWRISGIERDVALFAQPKVSLRDFSVKSTLDDSYRNGRFQLHVVVNNNTAKAAKRTLAYSLTDNKGNVVLNRQQTIAATPNAETTIVFGEETLNGVDTWSAEQPNLYRLNVTLHNGKTTEETLHYNVGFRRVELKGNILTINGQPVKIKGVNIHEHNPATGHYVTEDLRERDFQLMKQHNINAVRCCHYPQARRFYELCDEYGIYVYDEANIESHGMGYNLSKGATLGNNPEWLTAHMQRTRNLFGRNKNHPCVNFWSLGNEAGNGYNFYETYRYLKHADSLLMQRPVNYERAEWQWNTDMFVPMYVSAEWLEKMGEKGSDRPVMPCEYSHAMGNSNGNISGMWQVINSYDNLAGGFIWDWIDQGLDATNAQGRHYWTYGGDYGTNQPSDGNFNCNGIVNPDRTPHPAMAEVKYAYQNIDITPADDSKNSFSIVNRHAFTNLNNFDLHYTIVQLSPNGTDTQASGTLQLDVAPLQKASFQLPAMPQPTTAEAPQYVNFTLTTRNPQRGLPAGSIVATKQIPLNQVQPQWITPADDYLDFTDKGNTLTATDSKQVQLVFDKQKGCITSYRIGGREYIQDNFGLQPNFWRAPTDNDYGNGLPRRCQMWKEASRQHKVKSAGIVDNNTLHIVYTLPMGNEYIVDYRITPQGRLDVDVHFTPAAKANAEVPRIGMRFRILKEYERVDYIGRGPQENYCDRKQGTPIGHYKTTAADLYFPYVRPQENGHHTDTYQLLLTNGEGYGLRISANKPFEFNALRNSVEDFDAEEATQHPYQWKNFSQKEIDTRDESKAKNVRRRQTHIDDITPRPFVEVCIDHVMTGVGGNDSWGALPDKPFIVGADKEYKWGFTIQPVK